MEAQAFGNYRQLLEKISTSAAMGEDLTYRGSVKFRASAGAMPDENYARELMQLFTIGLVTLNLRRHPEARRRPAGGNLWLGRYCRPGAGVHRLELRPETADNTDSPGLQAPPHDRDRKTRTKRRTKTFLGKTIAAGTERRR